jgi:hypothetical protein
MQRVSRASAVQTLSAPPIGGTPGFFTGGNPGLGQPATVPGFEWFNSVQEELIHIIMRGGITASNADLAQVRKSLDRLYGGGLSSYSANVSLTADDAGFVALNAAGGSMTVTLPAANAANGRPMVIRLARVDNTSNTVTVQRAGGDIIFPSALSAPVPRNGQMLLMSDGASNWYAFARTGNLVAPASSRSTQGITLGAGFSQTQQVIFIAPVPGVVLAVGSLNLSGVAAAAVSATLSIAGSIVSGDTTLLSQTHSGVTAVTTGQSVAVNLQVTTSTSPGVAATLMVSAIFIPT